MKKTFKNILSIVLAVATLTGGIAFQTNTALAADLGDVNIFGTRQDIQMYVGDTFHICDAVEISGYYDGDVSVEYSEYYNEEVIIIDDEKNVTAVGIGTTSIYYSVYYTGIVHEDAESEDDEYISDDDLWEWVNLLFSSATTLKKKAKEASNETYVENKLIMSGSIVVHVTPDMKGVSLSQKKFVVYIDTAFSSDLYWYSASNAEICIDLVHNRDFALDSSNSYVTIEGDNENISLSATMQENAVLINVSGKGKTKAVLTVNGRSYKLKIVAKQVAMEETGVLIAPGKTRKLVVKNAYDKIKWKSLDKNIATVNSDGVVKAKKKTGNVVITATIGDKVYGSVVSVVPQKIINAVNRGREIGKGTYSQDKRMQEGYYDCSSLVWRALSPEGIYLGQTSWAPTSKSDAKYCNDNNLMVKGGLSEENIANMVLLPGDLYFESNDYDNPLDGVYHVEMIAGFYFVGMDENNTPIVGLKWVNRSNSYYWADNGMVGRPYLPL